MRTWVLGIITVLGFSVAGWAQNNLSLSEALRTAKANNPVLKSERLNYQLAEADLRTAGLRPNPVLNNQSLQLVKPSLFPENTTWTDGHNRQVWWQLTKSFHLPRQRANRLAFARQSVLVTEHNYAETERNFSLEVASRWLEAWSIKTRLQALTQAQANVDSLVYANEVRLKNQVISQTDLIRTQLLSTQYTLQLKRVRQDYRNALGQLKLLMGSNDSLDIDVDAPVERLSVENPLDSLLNAALSKRTDIRAAQSSVALSEQNVKLQASLAWPQPELGVIWNPQNMVPYLGFFGTIELPVFSRNQGEIQKSQVLRQQAQQNLFTAELRVRTELEAAYQSYRVQKENVAGFQGILQQSEQVLSRVRYAYLRGGTTIIDLLEAQRSWYEARQGYYDALLSYHQSYLQLLYVAGLIHQL